MKKFLGYLVVGLALASSFANAALTPPVADYADIYTMASYSLGILVVLFLLKKAMSFIK